MARLESVAIGGYYKTPTHLLARIAQLASAARSGSTGNMTIADPCAGDGEAVQVIGRAILGTEKHRLHFNTCELEATRSKACVDRLRNDSEHRYGDAFVLDVSPEAGGASVLYLNPPYDIDRRHRRLEEKFLDRFAPIVVVGGVLFFVVPHYALAASSGTIATYFEQVRCFRFPDEDFAAFKQVVLVGVRRSSLDKPAKKVVEQVERWAADASSCEPLPELGAHAPYTVPIETSWYKCGVKPWQLRQLDVAALSRSVRPWWHTLRGGSMVPVAGVLPELPVQELLLRRYPMATPPRPAHIAVGVAAGLFNGSRLEPNEPWSGLPSMLVKGVFDREYKTISEKLNKDGECVGLVQVQQPKLVVTTLDLEAKKYRTLGHGPSSFDVPKVDAMTISDLLDRYGESMAKVMREHCPVTYDPRRDDGSVTIYPSPRTPFRAQGNAIAALVTLFGGDAATKRSRRYKAAILLGEIGSGKSTVALLTARTIGSRRPLVLCPPHLLTSWTNEVASVAPDAEVRILSTIADVDALIADTRETMIVCVLSREAAKLSHGWVSAPGACSKCGAPTPDEDLAKSRTRCAAQRILPRSKLAILSFDLAQSLLSHHRAPEIDQLLHGRIDRKRIERYEAIDDAEGSPLTSSIPLTPSVRAHLLVALDAVFASAKKGQLSEGEMGAIFSICSALDDPALNERTFRRFESAVDATYSRASVACCFAMLIAADAWTDDLAKSLRSWASGVYCSTRIELKTSEVRPLYGLRIERTTDGLYVNGGRSGTMGGASAALGAITKISHYSQTKPCGEPLFQAIPEPRRMSLARHISKRHPEAFDFLVLDEGHEYATDGSAQERSAHRLTSLAMPKLIMTGSLMNGYAESVFTNMWAFSPAFRKEFARGDRQRFIDRYGYRKRLLEDRDKQGAVVEYGSHSDRVKTSERVIGSAPGILPLFLLRHLLPISVTLHKADLAIDLPRCVQVRCLVQPGDFLRKRFERLKEQLATQIKRDRFVEKLSGKLFGQLAELPSYLDRATLDTGNCKRGDYEIRYPASVGSDLVVDQAGLDMSIDLPKEQWMLETVERELVEGRNVMVFGWHLSILPRLSRLITEHTGEAAPILLADKVPTAKRQDWIEREIVKKGRRILVTNPVCIQTGLNNLVHFATELWMENPACNPLTYRQAIGRVDRIGQKLETRIFVPIYAGTLQEQLYDLLMAKVAVSISTDGLDPESALRAAGAGEDEMFAGLSIGKMLWNMMQDEAA